MINDHSQTDEDKVTLIDENDEIHDDSKTDFNKKSIDDDCDRDVQLEDTNVEINNVNDDNTGMRSEGEDEIMEENENSNLSQNVRDSDDHQDLNSGNY